ncbi:MAG: 3-deoxy-manno-octulosonate cytidylyltransferase [Acidobacteria bacterium]|nr:3-deoxy-manno-octulosonate cytidylyltransferase [Acidobacteriota bacterium]
MARILAVIPARFASSRFPGKPLSRIGEKTMLECVHERVARARLVDRVVVATDDLRILEEARRFGAQAMMTSPNHSTGTERVAEVAALENAQIIVNVQADEPLLDPAAIDLAIGPLLDAAPPPMATLKKRITHPQDLSDPNVVKVVTDFAGNAVYFSRSLIPFPRDEEAGTHFKHIGLYVYEKNFLLRYPALQVGPLERAEKLEQLRALENGYSIRVVETDYESIGVDTPQDLERVLELLGDQQAFTAETQRTQRSAKKDNLTQSIIGAAIEVHRALGPGLLESAYLECLCRELAARRIPFVRQVSLPVEYKGVALECGYRLDLLVADKVVLEVKAVEGILPVHEAQLLTYLRLGGWKVGLLINFNVPVLKQGIRRRVLGLKE